MTQTGIWRLIDHGKDGTYDVFYNNVTEDETDVEKQENGTYLIDSDGDGEWDYYYDPETNKLSVYSAPQYFPAEEDYTLYIVLIVIVIVVLVIFAALIMRKQTPKKPGKK